MAAAACRTASTTAADRGSIEWYAHEARREGKTHITIPAPIGMYARLSSLDEALSTQEAFIGTPIASFTQVFERNRIVTWYKLRVLESLVRHPNPEVAAIALPQSLEPVLQSEMVIFTVQGTVSIDGVRVTMFDRDCRLLDPGRKYVFFVSPDSSGRFAWLRAGPNAVFAINPQGKLEPLVNTRDAMQLDLAALTGNSLDRLRKIARAKAAGVTPLAN
ncbi:MAG TPA: hypothetical protein VKX25_11530 [Bryobacteraceae bacterium]|jgi:hypothetical protein|nr:hypothetical protein [Bryobacteraceae bacterium]